jgi:lipopolysaccharide export LptBFGC system permease protein LptF
MLAAKAALADRRGEGFIDTAIKILMAVVIGALILAGLYALFGDTILPTLTQRIKDMFNYAG